MDECTLEKTQIKEENVNLELTIDKLNESYKKVENTKKELKKENEIFKTKFNTCESIKFEHVNIKRRMDNLILYLNDFTNKNKENKT